MALKHRLQTITNNSKTAAAAEKELRLARRKKFVLARLTRYRNTLHSPYTCTNQQCSVAWRMARKLFSINMWAILCDLRWRWLDFRVGRSPFCKRCSHCNRTDITGLTVTTTIKKRFKKWWKHKKVAFQKKSENQIKAEPGRINIYCERKIEMIKIETNSLKIQI